jgi:hypothetical protein
VSRNKLIHAAIVPIPERYRDYFWDDFYGEKKTPLEKLILRVFIYGGVKHIREIIRSYPQESLDIATRYEAELPVGRGLKAFVVRTIQREGATFGSLS